MRKVILFLVVFCSALLMGCGHFKQLECTGVTGFKINKINTESIDAELQVKIKNPNRQGFSIYPSEFNVIFSGIDLGIARLNKSVRINANTEEVYNFNLKKEFKEISLFSVMKLIGSKGGNGIVEIKGDLKAGKLFVKKKFPINLKERVGFNQ